MATTAPLTVIDTDAALLGHATRLVLQERIAELLRYRQWCRRQPNAAHWSPLRIEYEAELRALVRLARRARDLSRPAIASAEAQTKALALGDHYAYAMGAR